MLYNNKEDLPAHAQEIYLKAFNNAWEQYKEPKERRGKESREEFSHKVAWAAVKQSYKKRPFWKVGEKIILINFCIT